MRLLIVEDNEEHASLFAGFVCDRYSVTFAQTLSEGIRSIAMGSHDIVVYDLDLPDTHGDLMAGLEAIVLAAAPTPVVVWTGHDDEVSIDRCLSFGAHSMLVKVEHRRFDIRLRLREAERVMRAVKATHSLLDGLEQTWSEWTRTHPALPAVGAGGATG